MDSGEATTALVARGGASSVFASNDDLRRPKSSFAAPARRVSPIFAPQTTGMQKTWILLGLAWCGTWGATAQAPFDFEIAGQVLSLEERRAREQTPGLALAVFLDGQLDTLINLGWRDREQGLPVDAHTRFQVGSMSQPLTHLAVLKLVGSGRLNLDADVNTYLRSWQLPGNRHTRRRPVSIRDLLLETR